MAAAVLKYSVFFEQLILMARNLQWPTQLSQWSTPYSIQLLEHLILMGRNSRWPSVSNHGARPCSSVMRRMRKKGFYLRAKNESTAGVDGATDDDELDMEGEPEDEEEEVVEEDQSATADGTGKEGENKQGKPGGKIDDDEDIKMPPKTPSKGKK